MDVGTSSTEIYPISICEQQMVVKVCSCTFPVVCCLFLSLLSIRKWYQDLICEQDVLSCFYVHNVLKCFFFINFVLSLINPLSQTIQYLIYTETALL